MEKKNKTGRTERQGERITGSKKADKEHLTGTDHKNIKRSEFERTDRPEIENPDTTRTASNVQADRENFGNNIEDLMSN